MRYWRRKVMSLTQAEIAAAVADPVWQEFRESLKGVPTGQKLDQLEHYLRSTDPAAAPEEVREREVRVDNYINALLRGGQLRKICHELIMVKR